ncbi:hypothetical protein KAR91_23140 [Candidatus Pacearchaeota archaeon]|nr:hypothetical protein [Candidatus Pacearchaeota archaeon]
MKKKEEEEPIEIDNSMIKMIPQLIANSVGIAKYYRAFYELLVKEGFTEMEALQIIIGRGMDP